MCVYIYIYIYIYTYIPCFWSLPPTPPLTHPSSSSQSTKRISLCYTQLPTSYLFYTWSWIYVNSTLATCPSLFFHKPTLYSYSVLCLYSFPANRFILYLNGNITLHIYLSPPWDPQGQVFWLFLIIKVAKHLVISDTSLHTSWVYIHFIHFIHSVR